MTTVLVFGDSNTHGTLPLRKRGELGRHRYEDRWTTHALRELPKGINMIAEGHPGRTTVHDDPIEGAHKNGATALPAILESHRPIDVLILALGTNDLKPRFSVSASDIALSVERLARLALASCCGPEGGAPRLLIVAPPPVEEAGCLAQIFEGAAARSRQLAAPLRVVADALGASFVDAGDHIAVSDLDGVHFDREGHAALGQAIGKAIAKMLD